MDAAFQILRAHYAKFVMCAALAYVPMLIIRLIVIGDPRRVLTAGDPTMMTALVPRYVSTSIVGVITLTLMSAVLVVCTAQAYLGEEVDVGIAVRRVAGKLPVLVVATILTWLMLLVAFVFFFFPALYVAALTFAVLPAIMLEDGGLIGGFRRSEELSQGRKWHILNTIGLAVIIYFVIYFGVAALAAIVGNFVLSSVATTVVSICVYPVVAITNVLLYYDARIQREGLDIELMADALTPTDPSLSS